MKKLLTVSLMALMCASGSAYAMSGGKGKDSSESARYERGSAAEQE